MELRSKTKDKKQEQRQDQEESEDQKQSHESDDVEPSQDSEDDQQVSIFMKREKKTAAKRLTKTNKAIKEKIRTKGKSMRCKDGKM